MRIGLGVLLIVGLLPEASGRSASEVQQRILARDFGQAIELAEAWTKAAPESSEAWTWLARAHGNQAGASNPFSALSHARSAKAAYERAVGLDPRNFRAQFDLIVYYLAAPAIAGGGKDQARAQARRIAALDPAQGHRAQATVLIAERQYAEAERELRRALALNPNLAEAWVSLIGLAAGPDPQAPNLSAQALVLQEALAILPDDLRLRYQRGRLAALGVGDPLQGLADLDLCLASPEPPDGVAIAGAHWRRGQLLLRLDRRADAIAALERAVAMAPRNEEMKKDLERAKSG